MSAVRMVAYGVLTLPALPRHSKFEQLTNDMFEEMSRIHKERDTIKKLVNDELSKFGLHMKAHVAPRGQGKWTTIRDQFELYGPKTQVGWPARQLLCTGSMQECCVAATVYLDTLDTIDPPQL